MLLCASDMWSMTCLKSIDMFLRTIVIDFNLYYAVFGRNEESSLVSLYFNVSIKSTDTTDHHWIEDARFAIIHEHGLSSCTAMDNEK